MDFYTLNEVSAKLKQHRITADYRKLIRDAIDGKLGISIRVFDDPYSPTIQAKCQLVLCKHLNAFLGIVRSSTELQDEVSIKFESELISNVFNRREWARLSDDEKISCLSQPSQEIQNIIERFSNPSIGGYFFVPSRQLINIRDGLYRVNAVTDGKETYFTIKDVSLNDLFIDENQIKKYIESFANKPRKPKRRNRFYTELDENIPNWKNMDVYALFEMLKAFAGKDGSCIVSVSNNNVTWEDLKNLPQTVRIGALQKQLAREKTQT